MAVEKAMQKGYGGGERPMLKHIIAVEEGSRVLTDEGWWRKVYVEAHYGGGRRR